MQRIKVTRVIGLLFGCAACTLRAAPVQAADNEASAPPDPVVVQVGQLETRVSEFVLYLNELNPHLDLARLPSADRERLLREFAEQKLFALHARDQGLDQDRHIRARIEFLTDSVLAQAAREQIAENMPLSQQLLDEYYSAHGQEFTEPARVLLQHFICSDPHLAAEMREQLEAGHSYDELARHKGDGSGLILAERRWFTPEILLGELVTSAFQLDAGDVSPIIKTAYGHHVFRIEAKVPQRRLTVDEARPEIIRRVRQQRSRSAFDGALHSAGERYGVRLNLAALPE